MTKAAERRARLDAMVLSAPAIVAALLLIAVPIAFSVYLAFAKWQPDGSVTNFPNIGNLTRMLTDGLFWHSTSITLQLSIICIVAQLFLALPLAFLFSRDVRGHNLLQAMVLIPPIAASVAAALMWLLLLDPNLGAINRALSAIGIAPVEWLSNPKMVIWSLAGVDTWQWTPFMALIIAAGIRNLPREVFEAAAVDGASGLRMAWHVALPLLKPYIIVAILLRSVDLIRFFDTVFVMTQGGPINSSMTLNMLAYRTGFVDMDMSYASMLQIALLVIVAITAFLLTMWRRRVDNVSA